jgi:dihydrolipoamide dehydrogenase
MNAYDVLLIGSGGGTKIAQALARLGRRVAVIERERPGGTCLNRGCIPSKMLIHPAGLAQRLRDLRHPALRTAPPAVDFEALVASINAYTDGTSDSLAEHFAANPAIDFIPGDARFLSDRVVAAAGREFTAPVIVIATGARPHIPAIPGLAGTPFMTSTEALRNRSLPPRLAVLGGGYIGAELGGAYAGFGCHVTFLLRSTFLKREDPDIVAEFTRAFSPGKTIHPHARIQSVAHRDGVFTLACTSADSPPFAVEAEALLVATGVVPNSDTLGLENTGIRLKPDGFIAVDVHLQTAVPGVFAIGDVVGNHLFRHGVNFEAEYWIDANFLSPAPFPIAYPPMPGAVFTHPEIASVGLTEPAARGQGIDLVIGQAHYPSCAMAIARHLDHGLVKLLFARDTGQLLGAHIVGEEASTLIQELVLALTHRLTAADIYRQIYIHPAFPEVVRNAVRHALKQLDPRRAGLF